MAKKKKKDEIDFIKRLKAPLGSEGLNLKEGAVKFPEGGNEVTRALQNIPTPLKDLREKMVVTEVDDTINRKYKSGHKENRAADIRTSNLDNVEEQLLQQSLEDQGINAGIHGEGNSRHLHAEAVEQIKKIAQATETIKKAQETSVALTTPQGRNVANHLIDTNPQLNNIQKENSKKDIGKNPETPINAIIDNKQKEQENKKPNVKNSFMEALTFFLPNIVGLAAGGLIGGAEGAVLGEEKGGQLGTGLREYRLKQEELEARKLKESESRGSALKLDVTPDFQTKDTKEALFTKQKADGNVGFFKVGTGEEVAGANAEKIQEASMAARETRLTSQAGKNFTQKQAEQGNAYVSKFRTNYKADIDQINQMRVAEDLIDGKQLSPDQLATFNAKVIFQEARITDEDVIRARIPQNLLQRMLNAPESFFTGKITPEEQKAAKKLLNVIMNRKRKILEEAATRSVTPLKLKATGLTKDELLFEFRSAVGLDAVKSKKVYTNEEIDKMSKEELKAYLGEK